MSTITWNLIQVCFIISIATGVSPLVLRELTPGSHRVRIDPVCEGEESRVVAQFEVEE